MEADVLPRLLVRIYTMNLTRCLIILWGGCLLVGLTLTALQLLYLLLVARP